MNEPNKINVAVENGMVKVLSNKIEKTINAGKQISVDGSNNIKESIYISFKVKAHCSWDCGFDTNYCFIYLPKNYSWQKNN